MVIFTSDHGEGAGFHGRTGKWTPYEESAKVPLIFSWPGRMEEGVIDRERLTLGTDPMATMCDFAGIGFPEHMEGRSLRPFLEGRQAEGREFVVAEWQIDGRMLRSPRYKYAWKEGDPVELLFDLEQDPWETVNLFDSPAHADILRDHRRMLRDYDAMLRYCELPPRIHHPTGKPLDDGLTNRRLEFPGG